MLCMRTRTLRNGHYYVSKSYPIPSQLRHLVSIYQASLYHVILAVVALFCSSRLQFAWHFQPRISLHSARPDQWILSRCSNHAAIYYLHSMLLYVIIRLVTKPLGSCDHDKTLALGKGNGSIHPS